MPAATPSDRRYTITHQWAMPSEEGMLLVGITDFAQSQLGDVMFVQLPDISRSVQANEACALVESVKTASDVYAPGAGTVVATTNALTDAPEILNLSPYISWFFKLRPDSAQAWETLMTAEQYDAFVG